MFQKVLTSALLAGFCAGLVAAALQFLFIQPVLLHAELYESGELVHFGGHAISTHPDLPAFALTIRNGLLVLFSALLYVGYALLLVACMGIAEECGVAITTHRGLIWGIAGFVVFHFAPTFSLPPEVPGVATVDLGDRQVWWWLTSFATALALGMIAFGKSLTFWVIAVVLILAPHLIGAPQPDSFAGAAPPELAALYASRTLGVGLAVWVLLGLLSGYFWQSESTET